MGCVFPTALPARSRSRTAPGWAGAVYWSRFDPRDGTPAFAHGLPGPTGPSPTVTVSPSISTSPLAANDQALPFELYTVTRNSPPAESGSSASLKVSVTVPPSISPRTTSGGVVSPGVVVSGGGAVTLSRAMGCVSATALPARSWSLTAPGSAGAVYCSRFDPHDGTPAFAHGFPGPAGPSPTVTVSPLISTSPPATKDQALPFELYTVTRNSPPAEAGSSASLKVSVTVPPSISPRTTSGGVVSLGVVSGVTSRRAAWRGDNRQSTLCVASWGSPTCVRLASAPDAAERMAPPRSASVFPSTAMPRVDRFGSTTSCANTSDAVPEPLAYTARFSPQCAGSMSIASPGAPVTATASLNVTVTRIVSPRA